MQKRLAVLLSLCLLFAVGGCAPKADPLPTSPLSTEDPEMVQPNTDGKESSPDAPLALDDVGICGKYSDEAGDYQAVLVTLRQIVRGEEAAAIAEGYQPGSEDLPIEPLADSGSEYVAITFDVFIPEGYSMGDSGTETILPISITGLDGSLLNINGEPYLTTPIDISGSRLAQGGSSVTRQAVFALPQDFTEYLIAFGDGQIAYYSGL